MCALLSGRAHREGELFMKRILDGVAKILAALVIGLGIALVLIVLLQIFGRVLGRAVSWTEELSRYLLAGIVTFATPLVARQDGYIRVDILLNKFPKRIQKIWLMILDVIVAVFLVVIAYHAVSLVEVGALQKSSVLRIPMSYMYLTVLVGPALTAVFFLEKAVNALMDIVKGRV